MERSLLLSTVQEEVHTYLLTYRLQSITSLPAYLLRTSCSVGIFPFCHHECEYLDM